MVWRRDLSKRSKLNKENLDEQSRKHWTLSRYNILVAENQWFLFVKNKITYYNVHFESVSWSQKSFFNSILWNSIYVVRIGHFGLDVRTVSVGFVFFTFERKCVKLQISYSSSLNVVCILYSTDMAR